MNAFFLYRVWINKASPANGILTVHNYWYLLCPVIIDGLIFAAVRILIPGSRLNVKTVFPTDGIPMLKIRRSRDRIIFNMESYTGKTTSLYWDGPQIVFVFAFLWQHLTISKILRGFGNWINISISHCQHRNTRYRDKTLLPPSYLHDEISYTGETTSLSWTRALHESLTCH